MPVRKYCVATALLAASLCAPAQTEWPDRFSPQARGYCERALLMAGQGNYRGVIDQIGFLNTSATALDASEASQCAYLLAQALYETGNPECVGLLHEFALQHPASPLALQARLAQADWYFFHGQWAEALDTFDMVDFASLDAAQLNLYTYRRALCRVKRGMAAEARADLEMLVQTEQYRTAARYYLAYADYAAGRYDKAYEGFAAVAASMDGSDEGQPQPATRRRTRRASPGTAAVAAVPRRGEYVSDGLEPGYYMAQIEFARGDYDDAMSHAHSLLERRPVAELAPEMQRIMGLGNFKKGEDVLARNWLETYITNAGGAASADARYALAVIDYREGRTQEAEEAFSMLADVEGDLGQSSYLYLGQIAASRGDNDQAALAFDKAVRMNVDPAVSETALYNYITSRLQGGNIPFAPTVEMLENFLDLYPDSQYAAEVQESLATAYYNERDYRRALASIEAIRRPSASVEKARQKVQFELGVEEMAQGHGAEAGKYLAPAAASKSDPALALDASLWLGDALYAQGKYKEAEEAYRRCTASMPEGYNRSLALYDLGYTLYQREKWGEAARYLGEAIDSKTLPVPLRDDATVRRADCFYYTGDYRRATELYTRAIKDGASAADYATLRRAVMYGHAGDIDHKLHELDEVARKWPDSKWVADAMLEKGETLAALGQTDRAAEVFERLNQLYPSTPQNRQGMLDMGIAYMRSDRAAEAGEAYRNVIANWPTSQEAALAHEDLRRLSAAQGTLAEYAEFLKSVPGAPQLNADQMESMAFEAAEQALADNPGALQGLVGYIAQYPDGPNLAQALFDLADAEYTLGQNKQALQHIDMLLERRADARQVPGALLLKADILESTQGADRTGLAEVYRQLEQRGGADFAPEAYAGIMRWTTDPAERIDYARRVLQTGGVEAALMDEARWYEAVGLRDNGDTAAAVKAFEALAADPVTEAGAKAAVTLGEHWLKAGRPDKAETVLKTFTDRGTPHQYWLARGFIALADTYEARNKRYLAVEYLRSLLENYPGNELDIHDMIAQRLKAWT